VKAVETGWFTEIISWDEDRWEIRWNRRKRQLVNDVGVVGYSSRKSKVRRELMDDISVIRFTFFTETAPVFSYATLLNKLSMNFGGVKCRL
jgi:hypothetical protein